MTLASAFGSGASAALHDPFEAGRRVGRAGAVAIVVLFGALFLWLMLAPLNGAVVLAGQVKVVDYRKTVQHLEGGIVQAILVKPGDHVKAGQPLLKLEAVQADAAVTGLQDQLDAERARSARADAERAMRAAIAFPAESRERAAASGRAQALLRAETETFIARRQQLTGQTALLRRQAEQVRAEVAALQNQVTAADANRKVLAEELAMNQDLYRRQFVQQTRLMAFERALADKDEARSSYQAELAKAQQKLVELALKAIALQDDYVRRASDDYVDANRRSLDLQERLRPLNSVLTRQVVVAPIAGEVVDLKVHTVGGVIAPREVLMEIVPAQRQLLIEGKVRPEDVAELRRGQRVDVQITAFKQRATPLLKGQLTYISGDSLMESNNGAFAPYYLVQASIDSPSEKALPARLGPGMPATLFIQTQARTAWDYLVQPLGDSMRKAFTEH